ncbi:MAG: hypothetical protein ABMA00_11165 [Gemmatimonas sp.]
MVLICSAGLVGCLTGETDVAVATDSIAHTPTVIAEDVGRSFTEFRLPASSAGHLQHVGLRLKFIACGSTGEAQSVYDNATDDANALLRELDSANEGINVVMRLKDNRIAQIRYGASEGVGCDRLPPEGELDAKGNEPFWSLRIGGDSARVRTPERPDGVLYIGGRWSRDDAQHWRYAAHRADLTSDTLTVSLTEVRCIDSMSAARYPFQVTLIRAGATLTGCALEGRRAFLP